MGSGVGLGGRDFDAADPEFIVDQMALGPAQYDHKRSGFADGSLRSGKLMRNTWRLPLTAIALAAQRTHARRPWRPQQSGRRPRCCRWCWQVCGTPAMAPASANGSSSGDRITRPRPAPTEPISIRDWRERQRVVLGVLEATAGFKVRSQMLMAEHIRRTASGRLNRPCCRPSAYPLNTLPSRYAGW